MSMTLNTILDSTVGATLLGALAAAILYGVTSIQTFFYFQNYHEDGRLRRSMILCLWILDTIHLSFIIHGVYFYLVTNFGNFEALLSPTWTLISQIFFPCISDFIVRSFFAMRVSILCGEKSILRIVLPLIIVTLSSFVSITGAVFASRSFSLRTYARIREISPLLYCSLGGSVAADSVIAISLYILLLRSRTGIKGTDSLVNVLMTFSINTGLLTSLCAISCFVTYALWPQRFIFVGIYFALSKLYVNSLLASLNARKGLRSQNLNSLATKRTTLTGTLSQHRSSSAGPYS